MPASLPAKVYIIKKSSAPCGEVRCTASHCYKQAGKAWAARAAGITLAHQGSVLVDLWRLACMTLQQRLPSIFLRVWFHCICISAAVQLKMRLVSLEEQVRWTEGSEQVVNRNTANLTLAKGLQARLTCVLKSLLNAYLPCLSSSVSKRASLAADSLATVFSWQLVTR